MANALSSPKQLAHADWLAANGDKTFRLDYPLNRDSIVLDVGGFEGQWTSDIFSRYLCRIHIFEPVPEFANRIARRFAANDRIKLHRLALGARSGDVALTVKGDASSVFLKGGERVTIQVIAAESVFESELIDEVDLMKVNIEGAEYDLLEYLIATGLIMRIHRLQVQFHNFVPDAEARMRSIQAALERTHRLTYQFLFIWENWQRKNLPA
jgi:FkbM family methyltransferase